MTVEFTVSSQPIAADLGEPSPKPTATTPGVVEATSPLWSAGGTEVGFWECSPGSFTARRDGYTEICQILAGSVTVETTGGARAARTRALAAVAAGVPDVGILDSSRFSSLHPGYWIVFSGRYRSLDDALAGLPRAAKHARGAYTQEITR